MPRTKKASSSKEISPKASRNKTSSKSRLTSQKTSIKRTTSSPKKGPRKTKTKTETKNLKPKRKSRSVLIDVIKDEPLESDSAWLNADDLKIEETSRSQAIISDNTVSTQSRSGFKASLTPPDNDDIDNQKKFFNKLATEVSKSGNDGANSANDAVVPARRVVLYRRLVIKFVILVAIAAAIVSYFSFSQLTVTLNLKGEPINDNLLLKIVDSNFSATSSVAAALGSQASSTLASNLTLSGGQNDPRETIMGTIKKIDTSVVKNYPSNGETFLGNEIIGHVNIINNYNRSQTLVATTRLLSPDNKLFRIKNAVKIPSHGQVGVDIYADNPTADMAIGPTRFTIPGLWVGLQDKIYAQSEAPFTYTQKIQKYVNASDLAYAGQDINSALITAAKAKASLSLTPNVDWLYTMSNPAKITINAKVGDKKNEFSAKASGQVIAVSFPKGEISKLAEAKLKLLIPDDKDLADFNPNNIIYNLYSYDPVTRTATVKASFTGTMILKSDASEISAQSLVGLTASQISNYLSNQSEVSSFTLKFSPSFIKRAPHLVDRIKIIINKN